MEELGDDTNVKSSGGADSDLEYESLVKSWVMTWDNFWSSSQLWFCSTVENLLAVMKNAIAVGNFRQPAILVYWNQCMHIGQQGGEESTVCEDRFYLFPINVFQDILSVFDFSHSIGKYIQLMCISIWK